MTLTSLSSRLLFLGLLIMTAVTTVAASPRTKPPLVVLKLDDLVANSGKIPPRWRAVIDLAESRKQKISVGIICNSLETGAPTYLSEIKTAAANGFVEFWHHGYDHKRWTENNVMLFEFKGTPEATQMEHLALAQRLALEKLGLVFRTFGAPFNATDAATVSALAKVPELTVWLFGDTRAAAASGKFVVPQIEALNIENPVHKPNYSTFTAAYAEHPEAPYIVAQGHPNSWDEAALAEYVRIIDFLTDEGATFIFPADLPAELASRK